MEVLQKGRLVRFAKRTDCRCAFSCSVSNQNGHFIRCIQSSSSQGYSSNTNHAKTPSAERI